MDRDEIAVEELKLLQAIIARQDEFKARAKTWAVTVVAALTTAYLTGQTPLNEFVFVVAIVFTSLIFMIIEGIFGSAERLAEERVKVVERALQTSGAPDYDGPRVCDSLLKGGTFRRMWRSMIYARTIVLYGSLVLFAAIVALAKMAIRP